MDPINELKLILDQAKWADIGQRYYLTCLSPNGSGWPLRISFAGGAAGERIGDLAVVHKPEPWAVSEVNCDELQLCWESDFHFRTVFGRRLMIRGDGYRRTWDRPLYRAWLNAWEQVLDLGHVPHNGNLGFNIGTEGICLHGYYLAPVKIVFRNQHSEPNYRRLMLVNAAAQAAPGSWSLEKLPLRWSALRKIQVK